MLLPLLLNVPRMLGTDLVVGDYKFRSKSSVGSGKKKVSVRRWSDGEHESEELQARLDSILAMEQSDRDAEIAFLLNKKIRTSDDEIILLLVMAAIIA